LDPNLRPVIAVKGWVWGIGGNGPAAVFEAEVDGDIVGVVNFNS
jgi:hypothetical protein